MTNQSSEAKVIQPDEGVAENVTRKPVLTTMPASETKKHRGKVKKTLEEKGVKQSRTPKVKAKQEQELSMEDLIEPAIKKVESYNGDYDAFEKFVYRVLHKNGLLTKDMRPNYNVEEKVGLNGSKELCKSVMKKKTELWKNKQLEDRKRKGKEERQKTLRATLAELTEQ